MPLQATMQFCPVRPMYKPEKNIKMYRHEIAESLASKDQSGVGTIYDKIKQNICCFATLLKNTDAIFSQMLM